MKEIREMVVIELTDLDARLFQQFQKRYQFIKLLEDLDAFALKNGHITIHFNNLGEVGSVDVQKHIKLQL